ncbi:unnamed protein product [Rhizophagus irregularis]|nr:unnamed protein product [Rhizophagus irregularis]
MIKRFRSWLFLRQPRRLEFKVLVSALRLNYKTCEGSGERKNQILALSSTTLALWNFRSRFFSISALRISALRLEGPGSSSTTSVFDIQFHILVLRFQFFLRLLRHLGISIRSWLFLRQLWRFGTSGPGSLAFRLFGSKSRFFSISALRLEGRSQFFSISALWLEGPGSSSTTSVFDIQFHILVLRFQFFLRLLRHLGISVSHTVLLFCFFFFVFSLRFFYFFLRKRRKEMTINA